MPPRMTTAMPLCSIGWPICGKHRVGVERDQDAGHATEQRGDDRSQAKQPFDVDAQQRRRLARLRQRAQGTTHARVFEPPQQHRHQHHRQKNYLNLEPGNLRAAKLQSCSGHAMHRETQILGAEDTLDGTVERNGQTDGGDHRRQMGRLASPERREDQAVKQPTGSAGDDDRRAHRERQRQFEKHHRLQRRVGAEHEDRAMGEVDDVQDAEDQGETESEKRIDAAQGNRVDELLGEHRLFLNDVLIALGRHHDGGLDGVVTGRLAVLVVDLAKLEGAGGAGDLHRRQGVA